MGLAPYGEPQYVNLILEHLLDLKPDGSFRLNMDYFNYATNLTMTNAKFDHLFGEPPRKPEAPLRQRDLDIARSIQAVTEEVLLRLGKTIHQESGCEYLCLAGGVALNCVANGRLQLEGPFRDIWVQLAAGDAGGALGAALAVWYDYLDQPRNVHGADKMAGAYLGPCYTEAQIKMALDSSGANYRQMEDADLLPEVVRLLGEEKIVGWFQGRMEFGPRALGNRSILGDARSANMQSMLNLKIKYRESFRPFAPAVLAERAAEYFELARSSPYMLLTAAVQERYRVPLTAAHEKSGGIEKLKVPRSTLPAVTHVDYSARIQTVHRETNPRSHALLKEFDTQTGCPVLVNTSFNVRGEPIVGSPADAYRCFMRTEMDYLAIGNFLLAKSEQPIQQRDVAWQKEFDPN